MLLVYLVENVFMVDTTIVSTMLMKIYQEPLILLLVLLQINSNAVKLPLVPKQPPLHGLVQQLSKIEPMLSTHAHITQPTAVQPKKLHSLLLSLLLHSLSLTSQLDKPVSIKYQLITKLLASNQLEMLLKLKLNTLNSDKTKS